MKSDQLNTTEAILLCRESGKSITKTALMNNGIRFGFASKSDDGFHWVFTRHGLKKYLARYTDPPNGWVTVSVLADTYDLVPNRIYAMLEKMKITVLEYGPMNWKYVYVADFDAAYKIFKGPTK